MDPISAAIIAALSAGATSAATDVAKKAIADGYEGLKALLKKKFGSSSDTADAIEKLQAKPDSAARRGMLAEELKAVGAAADPELLHSAQALLELVKALPQGAQHIQSARGTGIAQASEGSTASVAITDSPREKRDD